MDLRLEQRMPQNNIPSYATPVDEENQVPSYALPVDEETNKTLDARQPAKQPGIWNRISNAASQMSTAANTAAENWFNQPEPPWLARWNDYVAQKFQQHPEGRKVFQRLLGGFAPEDIEEMQKRGINPPLQEQSILPKPKQAETFLGGYLNSLAEDIVGPFGTPSGFVGSARPKFGAYQVNPKAPKVGDMLKNIPMPPRSGPIINADIINRPKQRGNLLTSGTRFLAGEEGIADTAKPYTIDLGPTNILKETGTVLPHEAGEIVNIPPDIAAQYGKLPRSGLGKPAREPLADLPKELPPAPDFLAHEKGLIPLNEQSGPPLPETHKTVPDYATPVLDDVDIPMFARTESGGVKIGADVESLGKILGSSLYEGDINKVAAKELIQNSLDATRHLGDKGEVNVTLNKPEKYVEVSDNGKGLTRQEIDTVFSDLGSSGKRSDESAIGGFGLAKAAPLLGGTKVEVTSIVKEADGYYKHTFSGTPSELLAGVDVKSERVANSVDKIKTGTTVRTYVPDQVDYDEPNFYYARKYIESLAKHSTFPGKIKVTRQNYARLPADTETYTGYKGGGKAVSVSSPSADVEITVPPGLPLATRGELQYQVLNNGMWQHSNIQYLKGRLPNIPENVLVNVKSKVPEGHADYPFTTNREALRGTTRQTIEEYLNENILKPAKQKYSSDLAQVYNSMAEHTLPSGNSLFTYDVGKKFSPKELQEFIAAKPTQEIMEHVVDATEEILGILGDTKTERIGMVLSEKLRGVNVPNPASKGKNAILINPYQLMEGNDPDGFASGVVHTILHEVTHNIAGDHDENFTKALSTIYEKYGRRRESAAADKLYNAVVDDRGEYRPEVQELLQRYTESRGRAETEEDTLIRTGVSSENPKRDRKKQVPINRANAGIRNPREAIAALNNALERGAIARNEQELMYSRERARRIDIADAIKTPGLTGFRQQLGALKGELPKLRLEKTQITRKQVDALIDAITNNTELLPYEKIHAKNGLVQTLAGNVPQRSQIKLLGKVFGPHTEGLLEMHGGIGLPPGKFFLKPLVEMAGLAKSLKSTLDLSAPLRQGLFLIHRPEYWRAFGEMFKYAWDEKYFDAAQSYLRDRPLYDLGVRSGLELTGIDGRFGPFEEAFMTNMARYIPLTGMSERAYVGFLNYLRAETFDSMVYDARRLGLPPVKVAPQIAKFVNTFTGRGSLDYSPTFRRLGSEKLRLGANFGNLEKVATELNVGIFSPKLQSSRLRILNPYTYVDPKTDPFIRKEAIKGLAATLGLATTAASLGMLMGGTVSMKMDDSDFLKVRFGNTRLDFLGGAQQYAVLLARVAKGLYNGEDVMPIIYRFMESKTSPIASLGTKILHGKKAYEPGGVAGLLMDKGYINKPTAQLINTYSFMFVDDLIDVYRMDPDILPYVAVPGLFGAGVQTYEDKQQKPRFSLRP